MEKQSEIEIANVLVFHFRFVPGKATEERSRGRKAWVLKVASLIRSLEYFLETPTSSSWLAGKGRTSSIRYIILFAIFRSFHKINLGAER